MKLHEILEEAYLDKFYRTPLGKIISNPNATFREIQEELLAQKIFLWPQESDDGFGVARTMSMDDALGGLEDWEDFVDSSNPEIQAIVDEARYLTRLQDEEGVEHIIYMEVPVEFNTHTKLSALSRDDRMEFIHTLQHELIHTHQPHHDIERRTYPYIGWLSTGHPFDVRPVRYITQVIERPAYAVNMGAELVQIGKTPEQVFSDMKAIAKKVQNATNTTIYDETMDAVPDEYEDTDWIRILGVYAITQFLLKHPPTDISENEWKERKTAYEQLARNINKLFKQVRKTYRQIKGYRQRYHETTSNT